MITPLLLDVSRPIQVMAAVRAVTAHAGPAGLAGLVNDAGTDGSGPRPGVSVTGELAVTRAFVPLLCRAQGRIVMIGPPGPVYPAVRGPLAAMSRRCAGNSPRGTSTSSSSSPVAAAGAVARALTAPRPRVAEGSCP